MRISLIMSVAILSFGWSETRALAQTKKPGLDLKSPFKSVYDFTKPPLRLTNPVPARDKLAVPVAYLSITGVTSSRNADAQEITSKTGLRITGHYHNYNRKTISGSGIRYRIDVFNGEKWTLLKHGQVPPTLANKGGAFWVDVPLYRFEKRTFQFEIAPSVEGTKDLVIPPGETNSGPRGSHGEIPIRPAIRLRR